MSRTVGRREYGRRRGGGSIWHRNRARTIVIAALAQYFRPPLGIARMYSQVQGGTVDPPGNSEHDDPPSTDVESEAGAPSGRAALAAEIAGPGEVATAEAPAGEAAPPAISRPAPVAS